MGFAGFGGFGQQESSYQGPPPPGEPILGLGNLLSDIANIIPGLAHIAKQSVIDPLLSFGGHGDVQEQFSEAATTTTDFAAGLTRSVLGTTLLPLSPLEAVMGSDDFKEALEFLPENIRPSSPGERYLEGRGVLPALFEDVGNVALLAGGVGAAGKALGLPETSALMRGANVAKGPYRAAGRAGERFIRGQSLLGRGEPTVTLYHGTSKDAAPKARLEGFSDRGHFSTSEHQARGFAKYKFGEGNVDVIELKVPESIALEASSWSTNGPPPGYRDAWEAASTPQELLGVIQRAYGEFIFPPEILTPETFAGKTPKVKEVGGSFVRGQRPGAQLIPYKPPVIRPGLADAAKPITDAIDRHRLKTFMKEQAQDAHRSARQTKLLIEKQGLPAMNYLRDHLGKSFSATEMEKLFEEEVEYASTVGATFDVPGDVNLGPASRVDERIRQIDEEMAQLGDRYNRGVENNPDFNSTSEADALFRELDRMDERRMAYEDLKSASPEEQARALEADLGPADLPSGHVRLYHGTTAANAARIREEGFKGRPPSRYSSEGPRRTYFTTDRRLAEMAGAEHGGSEVLHIDVPREQVLDAIEEAEGGPGSLWEEGERAHLLAMSDAEFQTEFVHEGYDVFLDADAIKPGTITSGAPPRRQPTGLKGFVPAGHRSTLSSLDDTKRAVAEEILARPEFQTHVTRLRDLKARLNAEKYAKLSKESPLGAFGLEPGKPGTYVTAKKRQVRQFGIALRDMYRSQDAKTGGVLAERQLLKQMSEERHAAADVWDGQAQLLEQSLPTRVNPIDPEIPYKPDPELPEAYRPSDFEYPVTTPESLLERRGAQRLGRYDVQEEQLAEQLTSAEMELDGLRSLGEENLSSSQLDKLDDLEDTVTELSDRLSIIRSRQEKYTQRLIDKRLSPEEQFSAEKRAAVRTAVDKERAAAKLRAAKSMAETMRRRATKERAAATRLAEISQMGDEATFAQYKLGERLQRQAERILDRATRGGEFVDPRMVPDEWFDIARGQKELYNTLNAISRVGGALAGPQKKALPTTEVRAFMAENQLTWPDIVRRAAEQGFTPVHMRQFTKQHADRFARDTFRLSPSKLQTAGTRKNRRGLIPAKDVERGFRAWIAESGEVAWEVNSNNIVDYLTDHGFVQPLDPRALANGTHVAYRLSTPELGNPELRQFLEGADVDPDSTKFMIPKQVGEALRAMNRSYDNPVSRGLAKITDPWRTAALTFSPRWYVYNTIGNFILTSAEIGPVNAAVQWTKQWRKLKRDIGGLHNIFTPEFALREVDPAFVNLGIPTEVAGIEELRTGFFDRTRAEAKAEGQATKQFRTGASSLYNEPYYNWWKGRMQRLNEVVDEISRESVKQYYMEKKGASPEAATKSAIRALVNYSDLSPFERTIIRSFFPFYAWQKGMLKNAVRLSLDHPARVQLTVLVGRINRELWDEEKQTLPEYYQGLMGLPGGLYLQTRGMNPFADAPALVTPQGIASALNPFLEIGRKWAFRDQGTPFGPKEPGPFGTAVGRPDVGHELLRLGANTLGGGILRNLAEARPDQPLIPSPGAAFGLRTFSPDEVSRIKAREAQQQAQVAGGLPLPPTQASSATFGGFGLRAGPNRNRSPFRLQTARLLGVPLVPTTTSNLLS